MERKKGGTGAIKVSLQTSVFSVISVFSEEGGAIGVEGDIGKSSHN